MKTKFPRHLLPFAFSLLVVGPALADHGVTISGSTLDVPDSHILMDEDPTLHITVNSTVRRNDAGAGPANVRLRYQVQFVPPAGEGDPVIGGTHLVDHPNVPPVINLPISDEVLSFPMSLLTDAFAYTIVVTVSHEEDTGWVVDGTPGLKKRIGHFTRRLDFGGGILADITGFAQPPVYTGAPGLWRVWISDGELLGSGVPVMPLAATPFLDIQRDPLIGDMDVLSGELRVLAATTFDMAGFPAQRGETRLGTGGITTEQICFQLPAGIGWRPGTLGLLNQDLCSVGSVALGGDELQPLGSFGAAFPAGSPVIVADVLPLSFDAVSWIFDAGKLTIPAPTNVRFLRAQQYTQFAGQHGGDLPDSNAGLWRSVALGALSDLVITGGADGGISINLAILPSQFDCHFPLGEIVHAGGTVRIVNNRIDSATSLLNGPTATVRYSRECPPCPGEASPDPLTLDKISLTAGTMAFTPSGGLHGAGIPNPGTLRIGRSGANAVHSLAGFTTADFHMPGAIVPPEDGFDSPFDTNSDVDEPGELPLAFNPARHLMTPVAAGTHAPLHPGTLGYLGGIGHLAGINFKHFPGLESISRIGGGAPVNYDVATWWRGYVRQSGFSGIHQSDPGDVPPQITVFDYGIDLDNIGWSYLANTAIDSITEGTLEIPYPASFSIHLLELGINCCGEPTGFDLAPDDRDKTLAYWGDSQFHIQSGRFDRGVECENACSTGPVLLALGVDAPIGGTPGNHGGFLYPLPIGQLTDGTEVEGRESRLVVGPTQLRGYDFLPVREAYFNDQSVNPPPPVGFQILAGATDVSFFEEIIGVTHTKGRPSEETNVEIRQSWEDAGGKTFFTLPDFDPTHRGFAPSTGLVAEYRDAAAFDPIAGKDWFGGRFDFPVVFHDLGAQSYFRSDDPGQVQLVIGTHDGQVRTLTRDTAHVTFGSEFEFLPKLTLSNGAALGIDSLTQSIEQLLVGKLGSIQALLDTQIALQSTNVQTIIGDNFGSALDLAIVNPMLLVLRATNCEDPSLVVNTFLDPFGAITDALEDVSGAVDNFNTLNSWIADNRAKIQNLRDQLSIIRYGTAPDVVPADLGLLTDEGLRQLLDVVIAAVPSASIDSDLVEEIWIEMIGTGPFDSAVKLLRDRAEELLVVLDDLIGTFDDFGEFALEVQAAVATLTSEMAAAIGYLDDGVEPDSGLKLQIFNYIAGTLCEDMAAYSDAELRPVLRGMIMDRLLGLDSIGTLESILRTFVYHTSESLKELIASALDLINGAARTVAGAVLFLPDAPLRAVQGFGTHFLTGGLTGYAVAEGDDMRQLRLDGNLALHLPTQVEFKGFLEYNHLTSEGPQFCNGELSERAHELLIGASGGYAKFLRKARKMSVTGKWGFTETGGLNGFAGSLELLDGGFSWASLNASKISAHMAIGLEEYYLAAGISAEMAAVSGFGLTGGFFTGKTCNADPLAFLPGSETDQFDGFLPFETQFSGGIAYAEGAANVFGRNCLARLRVGAGVGGYLLWDVGSEDDVAWGGRLKGFASGELLCLISGKGEIVLDGRHTDGSFNMNGRASITRKTIIGKNKTRTVDVHYRRGLGFSIKR
jgi:hypothetical protein